MTPANTVEHYISTLPLERQEPMTRLREVIRDNLPEGFQEVMTNTPSWVVPLAIFPEGYHCTKDTPLPYMSIASQKNFIALYHFGIYVDQELLHWFMKEYPKHIKTKLDMGKSCIRFKKIEQISYELIGELATKRTVDDWIASYKEALDR